MLDSRLLTYGLYSLLPILTKWSIAFIVADYLELFDLRRYWWAAFETVEK